MKPAIIPQPKSLTVTDPDLRVRGAVTMQLDEALPAEGYRLAVSPEGIAVTAGSEVGKLRANSTLEQLKLQYPDGLPGLVIEDAPSHPIRSIHLDCVRHFFPMEQVKKMLRCAAAFKINRLHWHISDDQGWRIESERFPKLQEISAWRKGDDFGRFHSDQPHGGYYTKAQVRELVEYCGELGIEIVPEVDVPGHVVAILAAYPHLSCTGNPIEVWTMGGVHPEIFCAGKEEVYEFLEELFDELLELFPGKLFHIGGDEAPKTNWRACPHCRRKMEEEGLTSLRQLQGYMANRMADILRRRGRQAIVWNDAAYGGNLDGDIVFQVWFADEDGCLGRHAKNGGQFILSPTTNCYFDYPYGITSLQKAYELDLGMEDLPEEQILGTEALLWTEFIQTGERMEQLAWPRFAATAEVGWSGKDRPDYADFRQRLETLFPIFGALGIGAAPAEAWDPDPEEAKRQEQAFNSNYPPEETQRYQDLLKEM